MGMLIEGKWRQEPYYSDSFGRFIRNPTTFRKWITQDGSSGFSFEAGRYHLYISLACPWASRTLIMRKLKGLEEAISLSIVDSYMGPEGWSFSENPGAIPDSILGAKYLQEVYIKAQPDYTGRVTVPVLWDRQTETIVNNESADIMRMFDTLCNQQERQNGQNSDADPGDRKSASGVTFYPEPLREKIDETIKALYRPLNNGVYKAGFATTQNAYEEAVLELFSALDHWEGVLEGQRYLCGDVITEADWCLFTTLIRFDLVYVSHFKCNLRRIVDYPNLWNYLKDLYQVPGVAETCDFDHIKIHYFSSHDSINPLGIIPLGPEIDFHQPHDRENKFGNPA